ncbi:hypothetical protein GCM10009721_32010 [Terrabacter tumescens]|uniref:Uncharacterized protein n=1 Tax=Terrabacter tumescens TaxID=60443 RepID=A0ABQ2I6Y5_9MICO|nr:hypothetical protein GCM10009721_32010 [Terrabacter tumescens]
MPVTFGAAKGPAVHCTLGLVSDTVPESGVAASAGAATPRAKTRPAAATTGRERDGVLGDSVGNMRAAPGSKEGDTPEMSGRGRRATTGVLARPVQRLTRAGGYVPEGQQVVSKCWVHAGRALDAGLTSRVGRDGRLDASACAGDQTDTWHRSQTVVADGRPA